MAAARHAEGLFAWREASASWRRVWELWSSLPEDERPDVELAEAVVGCVRDAARVDLASDRSDSFLDLAREALADERVSGDDYATARLLDAYGSRLALTDTAAGTAALERAVALFERAGRPSAEHARAIGYARDAAENFDGADDRHRGRRAGPGCRHRGAGRRPGRAARAGRRPRAQVCSESGRVEEALAVLAQAQQRAVDGGAPVATCGGCRGDRQLPVAAAAAGRGRCGSSGHRPGAA